jgi:hypothetical protein
VTGAPRAASPAKRLAGIDDPRLTFSLHATDEECSIEGNCSAIDDETDREVADEIRRQLDAGSDGDAGHQSRPSAGGVLEPTP